MKLELIVANEEALKTLVEAKISDAQIAWDLAESLEGVEKAIKKFQDKRNELIKEFGKPNENDPEKFLIQEPVKFEEEIRKLLDVEVDVTFPKIPLDKLNGLAISSKEMIGWKALGIVSKT